jgi:hypothetical protein
LTRACKDVAVSSGDGVKRCITIIDIEKKKVVRTITMDTEIYSMAVRGRTIYYSAGKKGIKMINLSDKSVSDVINSVYLYLSGIILLHLY